MTTPVGPAGVEECEDNDCAGCAWCNGTTPADVPTDVEITPGLSGWIAQWHGSETGITDQLPHIRFEAGVAFRVRTRDRNLLALVHVDGHEPAWQKHVLPIHKSSTYPFDQNVETKAIR